MLMTSLRCCWQSWPYLSPKSFISQHTYRALISKKWCQDFNSVYNTKKVTNLQSKTFRSDQHQYWGHSFFCVGFIWRQGTSTIDWLSMFKLICARMHKLCSITLMWYPLSKSDTHELQQRIRMSVTKFRKTEFGVFIRVAISGRIAEGPRGYIISNRSGNLADDITVTVL